MTLSTLFVGMLAAVFLIVGATVIVRTLRPARINPSGFVRYGPAPGLATRLGPLMAGLLVLLGGILLLVLARDLAP